MAKEDSKPANQVTGTVVMLKPKAKPTPCPRDPKHTNTMIYSTKGRTRHCKCNDCGQTWKQIIDEGELVGLGEFAMTLADSLTASPVQKISGSDSIVMLASDAKEIAKTLRELAISQ